MNAKSLLDKCKSSLLRGTDVDDKELSSITVKCVEVREAPADFGSPAILDFQPLPEFPDKKSVPLNQTNLRTLVRLGFEDMDKLKGQFVTFDTYQTNDPRTNTATFGLVLSAVTKGAPAKKSAKKSAKK